MSARVPDRAALLDLIGSSWRTQAIHAMVRLRVADALAAGPLSAAALAGSLAVDEGALQRLLRGLQVLGLVDLRDGAYSLAGAGRLLRSGGEADSLCDWVAWWAGHQWDPWGKLDVAVREGAPTRGRCAGQDGYSLHAADARAADVFHRAMGQLSAGIAPVATAAVGALAPRRIVDVGGGRGEWLAQVLEACPSAEGVLLEQAHALPAAREHLARRGLLQRCDLLAGDFFREVPAGGDVYLLKSVLHNWDDDHALALLRTCRRAMHPRATLAVVERVIDVDAPDEATVRSDLNMLVSLGGRERTWDELHDLLGRCGLAAGEAVSAGEHRLVVCRPDAATPPST